MRPIRPIRGLHRYEEHHRYFQFSKKSRSVKPVSLRDDRGNNPAFPYGREAELHAAEDFARRAAEVLSAAAVLKHVLDELDETRSTSVQHRRIVYSSEPGAVSAESDPAAPVRTERLQVRRLASTQVIRSAWFAPDSLTTMEAGLNRLTLSARGARRELELYVFRGDSHRTVLKRLKNAVNEAGAGIGARLEIDPESGTMIHLVLESLESGTGGAFRLADRSGNTASASGLLVVDQEARDAEVRLGAGPWMNFPTNQIYLRDRKLTLTLHELPSDRVVLDIQPDIPGLDRKLQSLLHAVNVMDQALAAAGDMLNPAFRNLLRQAMDSPSAAAAGYRTGLASSGAWTWSGQSWSGIPEDPHRRAFQQLSDPASFTADLRKLVAQMEHGPSDTLLNHNHPKYKRYANYLATLHWYSQLPTKGLLLNRNF